MPASSEVTLNHWHVLGTIISLLCISLEMLLILKRGRWETKTAGYVSLPVQWETPWDSRLCCGQCYHLDVMRIGTQSIDCFVSGLDNRTDLKSFALWDGVEQRGLCRHLTPEYVNMCQYFTKSEWEVKCKPCYSDCTACIFLCFPSWDACGSNTCHNKVVLGFEFPPESHPAGVRVWLVYGDARQAERCHPLIPVVWTRVYKSIIIVVDMCSVELPQLFSCSPISRDVSVELMARLVPLHTVQLLTLHVKPESRWWGYHSSLVRDWAKIISRT